MNLKKQKIHNVISNSSYNIPMPSIKSIYQSYSDLSYNLYNILDLEQIENQKIERSSKKTS